MAKKALLMILDGWGIGQHGKGDVIYNTPTPYLDYLTAVSAHSQLLTCGEDVGLPAGQMGNSEVGHLNIGAGRIVYQDLVKINRACNDGSILKNKEIIKAYSYAKENGKKLHLMGLTSTGGVHSSLDHLFKFIEIGKEYGLNDVYVHCFMDGRDTDPKSGKGFIEQVQECCDKNGAHIASIVGRFYAMDRDKRWERVERAYKALVLGEGGKAASAAAGVEASYAAGVTDEFVEPFTVDGVDGKITAGDGVIFFNFRPDRAREITRALHDEDFPYFARPEGARPVNYVCMTQYDATITAPVAFPPEEIKDTLGEVLAQHGLHQLRIAETEKYAHVTFFFNGGVEAPNANEERILIPSPKVATYDLQPEMSAEEVTQALLAELDKDKFDAIILNFANPDMVGHTGVLSAAITAMEKVDDCAGRIVRKVLSLGGSVCITADHGNLEKMAESDGSPNTAHTTNPVPFILVSEEQHKLHNGILADIAPTLLQLLNIKQPAAMTGKTLID